MINLLNNKPIIGTVAGTGSGIFYILKEMLTDDSILKYVAGVGVWVGIMVAGLTLYLRIIEIKKLKQR